MWENQLLIDDLRVETRRRDEHFKRAATWFHNSRVRPPGIEAGDLVLKKETKLAEKKSLRKLETKWEEPYKVIKLHGNGAYVLVDCDGQCLAKT